MGILVISRTGAREPFFDKGGQGQKSMYSVPSNS